MVVPAELIIGIGVNDPAVNDVEDFTLANYLHSLRRIALHGYQAIEHTPAHQLTLDDFRRIAEETQKLGMDSWSVHSDHLNAPDEPAIKEYYQRQTLCARIASILGCKIMVFHPPAAPLLQRKMAEVVRQVAAICEDHGVRAGIENCTMLAAELVGLAQEADHPNLGFAFDSGHAQLVQSPSSDRVGDMIRGMGSRIWTTHLQDNWMKRDDHLPPGLGSINWRNVLESLWETGYDGPLMVEVTCSLHKASRDAKELQHLPLEVEQALGIGYLKFLHGAIRGKAPLSISKSNGGQG